MGNRKSSGPPGHSARLPVEKANGKARKLKSIAPGRSDAAFITAQVVKIAKEIKGGEVRPERIKYLKSLLDSNKYTIEPDEIARKMLGEIW